MAYWVRFECGWYKLNLMTDSIVTARKKVVPLLKTGRYGAVAWFFTGKDTEFACGEMGLDRRIAGQKYYGVWYQAISNGVFGEPYPVKSDGKLEKKTKRR